MEDLLSLENVILISIVWVILIVVYYLIKRKNRTGSGNMDIIDSGASLNLNISYNELDTDEDETADMVVSLSDLKSGNFKASDHIKENKDEEEKSVKIKFYTGSKRDKLIDIEKITQD